MGRTKQIALCGMLAAAAVVIMCLGGVVPVATYVCPVLASIAEGMVLRFCGKKLAWTWFAAVSVLCLLMGPDKEAVFVFVCIGYYPIVKADLDRLSAAVVWKLLLFNVSIVGCYGILICLLGMSHILAEVSGFGIAGLLLMLLLGNTTFFLLDHALTVFFRA